MAHKRENDYLDPLRLGDEAGAAWRALTRHSPNHILLLDCDGNILSINYNFTGRETREVIGSSFYDYFAEDVSQKIRASIGRVLTNGKPDQYESTFTDNEGKTYIFDNQVYPVIENGETVALVVDARDITLLRQQQEKLEQNHLLLNTVIAQSPIVIWSADTNGIFTLSEGKGLEALGIKPGEVVGQSLFDIYKDNNEIIQSCKKALKGETITNITHAAGRSYHSSYGPVQDKNGKITGVVGVANDITDLENIEKRMHILSSALEQTADLVLITDVNGIVEYVNPAFEKITGFRRDEVIGKKPAILRSGKHDEEFYQRLWETILRGEVFSEVFINARKDGSIYYEEKYITPIRDYQNNITHFISTGKDISERMRAQERLHYMAHHDALTKLPNRSLFMDRLRQAMARASWHKRLIAVMFLDLDRFKNINDSLGHQVGDQLLIQLTQRLSSGVRAGDTIARFGGDEFAILLDDIASEQDISQLAKKILDTMISSFVIKDHEFFITASIGVSIFPNDGDDPDTLIRNADVAMYRAKDLGRNNYQFYSNEMSARAFKQLTLENSLRHALKRNEFSLLYQPQVEIKTRHIVGVEALLRWQHPELGLIMPSDFIPLLEETGLIVEVGDWVLQTALEQAAHWHQAGFDSLKVSINLSGRQFNDPGFISTLESAVNDTGLNPRLIELELTESMLMRNASKTVSALNTLNQLGIGIAVDDFGTGYSSLNYLRRFPISTLKIDRSFIRDVINDPDDRAITTAIIVMAQSLNLVVIAEGVESEEQTSFLENLDCDQIQGNIFSSPVLPLQVTGMLNTQKNQ
jgi:diguanylate cyclase (GGDEF)-like protein/PAS domain S-box-containing protein